MKITVHTIYGLQEVDCIFVSGDYAVTKSLDLFADPNTPCTVTHMASGYAVPGGPFTEEEARCMAVNMERSGLVFGSDGLPDKCANEINRWRHARALTAARGCRFV